MRKSLDEIWKTPTPDMLEIRQEGIGTLRPIQQASEEKIGGKRGYRMQMQITIEIPFLVYYSFQEQGTIHLSISFSAQQTHPCGY